MMYFQNRQQAGKELLPKIKALLNPGEECIILAIPRGGVEVAEPLAAGLPAPLDVIIPRKLGAPNDPELAVGAITPDGTLLWNDRLMTRLCLNSEKMQPVVKKALEELEQRTKMYRRERPFPRLQGKTVIVVDDGIATGFTVEAALKSIKKQQADRVILGVPVGPAATIEKFNAMLETVCLCAPEEFYAVGEFYRDFSPTTHEIVISILASHSPDQGSQKDKIM